MCVREREKEREKEREGEREGERRVCVEQGDNIRCVHERKKN